MSGIFPSGGVGPSQALPTNLPTIDTVGTNCTTLYHNARCNTKVDPASVNALIAEIGTAVNGAEREYDCSRYDNLLFAIRDISNGVIFDCLEEELPDASGACSIEQVVLTRNAEGCVRLARLTDSSRQISRVTNSSVWGINYPLTSTPINPADNTSFYNRSNLATAQTGGTINETRLGNTELFRSTFNLACASTVTVEVAVNAIFNPAQNSPTGASSSLVLRVDGVFEVGSTGLVASMTQFTNFESLVTAQTNLNLSAGSHTISAYVIAAGTIQPAQVQVIGSATTSGGSMTIRVAVQ